MAYCLFPIDTGSQITPVDKANFQLQNSNAIQSHLLALRFHQN